MPHQNPTLPSIPAARDFARRLDTSLPLSSLPFPLPSLRPLPIYLSNYLPTPLPLAALSLPSLRPTPGPVYQFPLPILFLRPFFFPLLAPSPPRFKPRCFSFFSFFMLIRRDSNPSRLCLPINYQFNAYANCAIPSWLQVQWCFCMLFICKSNSCPSLAVENNDIMIFRPRGPCGPTGTRTKTNQSFPNIIETVAFSALRKLLFNGFLYLSDRWYI